MNNRNEIYLCLSYGKNYVIKYFFHHVISDGLLFFGDYGEDNESIFPVMPNGNGFLSLKKIYGRNNVVFMRRCKHPCSF